ncbi:MAG: hypothetical protein R3C52_01095 [Hyphomonadaceae bacterium]
MVIILDWVAEAPPVRAASRMVRGFSRRMRWLADFYDFIDTLLVRIGAHVAGMEHRNVASRYVILGGSILFLSIIAWHLPAPYGLIPAVIGFVVALSVSRLWSWVEDDRNLAAITSFDPNTPKKVGFREDYRDETLLGFIFVLVLIPIAMAQADAAQVFGAHLFDGGGDKGTLGPWLGYFGFELAKALPVVDWADIYNLQPGDDQLKPNGAIGMHAIFVARVTVDLVLIAALLQAISIATRNRQQKTLYAAGRIDRLDELVEKRELSKVLALPRNQRLTAKNVVDFRAYNRDRLKELYTTAKDNVLKAFIKELFDDLNDTLDPAIKVLDRLSATSRDEGQMHRTLDEAIAENGAGPYETPIGDLMQVMENLRKRPGLQSLKFEIMDFAMTLGSAQERAEFLESILVTAKDDFKYATLRAGVLLTRLVPKLNEHSFMVQLFEDIEGKRTEIFGANDRVPDELLDALRRRLTELRPTVSDERPEQKPGQEPEPVLRESESEAASTAPHTDQPESAPEPEKV